MTAEAWTRTPTGAAALLEAALARLAALRRRLAERRRGRAASLHELRSLDDRTLRDIGFSRDAAAAAAFGRRLAGEGGGLRARPDGRRGRSA